MLGLLAMPGMERPGEDPSTESSSLLLYSSSLLIPQSEGCGGWEEDMSLGSGKRTCVGRGEGLSFRPRERVCGEVGE